MIARSLFVLSAIGLLLGASVFLHPVTTHADSTSDIQAQIDQRGQQIADLEKEIAGYQKQLTTLGSQHQTLQTSIQSIDVARAQINAQIKVLQKKIDAATLDIQQLSGQIHDKEQSITLDQKTLAKSLRDIDTGDDQTLIEQLLSSQSFTDAWIATDQAASLNDALRTRTIALANVKTQLANQQQAVTATKQKLTSLNTDLGDQQGALDANRKSKSQLLAQTKAQESSYQSLIVTKRAEQAAFEAELFKLSSQLKAADISHIPPAGKGILAWPLDKITITQLFGRTSDSVRLYTSGTHDGVDFGAPIGTPVHAALTGTVVQTNEGAVQNCQYGKWVVIKHENGLSTLYAHLSQIKVAAGESVVTGQTIGYSGMTGYATGPHLHLTVYSSNAVSFKQYKCKSGYTVTIPIAPPNGYLDPLEYL